MTSLGIQCACWMLLSLPPLILQSRDVVVYRLVTCGTVEEKIYRKQVGLCGCVVLWYGIVMV